ncbi:conserved Plasmodium protein, unknown function [Plasmodium relictum]|uniref:Enhancer of polycomb-like protein n=1 Tax=Plasmodium relictum TaxID=85471 RepID=A0A1J1HAJ9_PLARL|nr:conserved Plasmodium protein, unknown function [Plasmodium relictum]CRH02419.1 conserved Plasmodium protein, unknown function [Plasmodium relictum]
MTKGLNNQQKNLKYKPIDINKKLLVIKSGEDLKKLIKKDNPSDEDISQLKSLLENNETKAEKKKKNIIIPRFKICDDNNYKLNKFEKPSHYIRYELYRDQVTGIKLSDGTIIHYDLLKEDELFLQNLNSYLNIEVNNEDFSKLIDKFEKLTGKSDNKEEINFKDALKAASELKITYKSSVIKDIYSYWKNKRKKLGRPLLRMFWSNSQNSLPHYSVFRPRVKEKMTLRKHKKKNFDVIIKMHKLIDDFKKLDKILRKIKQRDEKKLLLLQLNAILFDQRKNEIKDKTYVCPMWNYFKDYKIEKIYKKFKKDKFYKNLYNNINNNSLHNKKINKKLKSYGRNEQMNILKVNPNEYKNVVLIKRRGRSNRMWIDRKYVDDINNNDIDYCDLSYTFNDFVEASLNLKKNYEEDVSNYLSGYNIPLKLNVQKEKVRNLYCNLFNEENDFSHENYEEINKERKKENVLHDQDYSQSLRMESLDRPFKSKDTYLDNKKSNINVKNNDAKSSDLFLFKIDEQSNNKNDTKNNIIDIEEFHKTFDDKKNEGFILNNEKVNTTNNFELINNNNNCESTNYANKQNNKTIFHFEDIIDPLVNKDNYIFCLSKYVYIQKRILFYLENLLNFDNFNFKSKKKDNNLNSSQNATQNKNNTAPKTSNSKNTKDAK